MSLNWNVGNRGLCFAIHPSLDALLAGSSQVMQELKQMIGLIAPSDVPVLVSGPTGTGKEVVAHALHLASGRTGAMVPVNCGAIPPDLIESELFGHEKGAFTGAQNQRIGLLEQAHGGTLFLDEIGEMPANVQVKLLRALETKTIQRVGGGKPISVDFRLVSATNRNLRDDVVTGRFREDLLFRIEVFALSLPALAHRPEDIVPILSAMSAKITDARPLQLTDAAKQALCAYPWPGNVRELRNFHDRAQVLFANRSIDAADVAIALTSNLQAQAPAADSPDMSGDTSADIRTILAERKTVDFRDMVLKVEKRIIEAALDLSQGSVSDAARMLRLKRTTLIGRMQAAGLRQVP